MQNKKKRIKKSLVYPIDPKDRLDIQEAADKVKKAHGLKSRREAMEFLLTEEISPTKDNVLK